jgi:hypothetical protein
MYAHRGHVKMNFVYFHQQLIDLDILEEKWGFVTIFVQGN